MEDQQPALGPSLGRAAPVQRRLFPGHILEPWEVDSKRPWEGPNLQPGDKGKGPAPCLPPFVNPDTLPVILTPEPSPRAEEKEQTPKPAPGEARAPDARPDTEAVKREKTLIKTVKSIKRAKDAAAIKDRPSRMGRAVYSAWETHGNFGLIDAGESKGGCRLVTLHVPKFSHGYTLDLQAGDEIHATSIGGPTRAGRLDVHFVTRNKYYAPGSRVTSCLVGIPEDQWLRLMG